MRKAVLELEAPDRRLINNIHLIYISMKHLLCAWHHARFCLEENKDCQIGEVAPRQVPYLGN